MWRYLVAELPRALIRVAVALTLYGLITRLPWPASLGQWIGLLAGAGLGATLIVICGKLLYDTLFYDHYWRQMDSR